MTDTEKRKAAVDAVARRLVRGAFAEAMSFDRVGWEDYPGLSMEDWLAVRTRAGKLVDSLQHSDEAYEAAYNFLSQRAEGAPE